MRSECAIIFNHIYPAREIAGCIKPEGGSMNKYETIVIFQPEASKDIQELVLGKINDIVVGCEGNKEEIRTNVWGRRRLAYQVKKNDYGIYVQVNYTAKGEIVEKLANLFRVNDEVIKYMTVVDETK
jgi:small subunit ribosomal protein S6